MKPLADYFREVLGADVALRPCRGEHLPLFLAQTYELACGHIFGAECVFAIPSGGGAQRPTWHAKQREKMSAVLALPVVLVFHALSSRDRQRLIRQRVPFVVPFKQMFLPPLGIDLREWARPQGISGSAPRAQGVFTPTTQLVLLYALLREGQGELRSEELVNELGVSAMSVSRALRDLGMAGLMSRPPQGRRRPAQLTDERSVVWDKAQPFLTTPVRTRFLTTRDNVPHAQEAGLTALARVSSLAAPPERTVALGSETWRELRHDLPLEPTEDGVPAPGEVTIEVWAYPPKALSHGPSVDSLSLYLSLRDRGDERVELALEEAMEQVPW